jgi:Glycosyltransferase family 87
MDRAPLKIAILVVSTALAALSLNRGARQALSNSADLMRRTEEVALFVHQADPYDDPDMTYPPSALIVFTPLVAPFSTTSVRAFWLGLNLASLLVLVGAIVSIWGRAWPPWVVYSFLMMTAGSSPVRLAIGMGQFALLPVALTVLSHWLVERRRQVLAGSLLGVALAKPTLSLPFLGVLVVRRYKLACLAAIGFQVVATIAASLWLRQTPVTLIQKWVSLARIQQGAGLIDVPSVARGFWPASTRISSAVSATLLAATLFVLFAFRRKATRDLTLFALMMAAVFTYHRPYDLVLLLPAAAALIDQAWHTRARGWTLAAIVVVSVLTLPSDPTILRIPPIVYEAGFIVISYGLLGFSLFRLTTGVDDVEPVLAPK